MKLIFICSPLSQGDIEENIKNAKKYAKLVSGKGHIPFVPHLFFTTFLDENLKEERELGIKMGLKMMKHCDELWVFNYISQSEGMKQKSNTGTITSTKK